MIYHCASCGEVINEDPPRVVLKIENGRGFGVCTVCINAPEREKVFEAIALTLKASMQREQ